MTTAPPSSRVWTSVMQLRHRDLDSLGHVTGAAYMDLIVEARSAWAAEVLDEEDPSYVVVRQVIDYHHELRLSHRTVDVTVAVSRLGRSSFEVFEQLVTAPGLVHCTSWGTLLRWDRDARATMPLTDAERARIEPYVRPS
jgi:acyl-CoA thioesterase FadM